MEIILSVFYFCLFILVIHQWKFFSIQGISPKLLSGIFLLKVVFGLILWWIYTYYYTYRGTSDAFRYFDDATILFSALKEHPFYFFQMLTGIEIDKEPLQFYYHQMNSWQKPGLYGITNDNHTIIRLNALLRFFSWGHYHVHTIFMCFISFIGLTGLYKTFLYFLSDRKWELFFACYLIPSLLFWGSGVLKEGLLLYGMGMFVYFFFRQIIFPFTWKNMIFLLLSFFLLIVIKAYILLAIIPAVCTVLMLKFTGTKYSLLKFLAIHILLLFLALNVHRVVAGYDVIGMLQMKQTDFYNVAELWKAGSVINIPPIDQGITSIIFSLPVALFNALFRPHVFEIKSLFYVFSAIENLFFLLLIIIPVIFFKKLSKQELILFYFSVSFIFMLASLIGLVTPILGAIVRYKVPLLPFYILLVVMLTKKWIHYN